MLLTVLLSDRVDALRQFILGCYLCSVGLKVRKGDYVAGLLLTSVIRSNSLPFCKLGEVIKSPFWKLVFMNLETQMFRTVKRFLLCEDIIV